MQTITKFKAKDGREFNTSDECIDYESLIDRVDEIMNRLPKKPELEGCGFENGDGFIQHTKKNYNLVKHDLLKVIKKYIKHEWVQQTMDDDSVHLSYVGRLIDDYMLRPINSAWYRLMCIDSDLREWGQPYYAINPTKGKQICLNISE